MLYAICIILISLTTSSMLNTSQIKVVAAQTVDCIITIDFSPHIQQTLQETLHLPPGICAIIATYVHHTKRIIPEKNIADAEFRIRHLFQWATPEKVSLFNDETTHLPQ